MAALTCVLCYTEFVRGWWEVPNPDTTKDVFACLHTRGVRERNLHKNLKMYTDYAVQMCSKPGNEGQCRFKSF